MVQSAKGSYVLLIQLPREHTIKVGSLKAVSFPDGYYAYVGSAMGGFKSRLSRHLKRNKKPQWHIDYLLEKASISSVILCKTKQKDECAIAQALSFEFNSIPGFGASDCQCRSHLFFAADERQMRATIMATLTGLGMQPTLAGDSSITV